MLYDVATSRAYFAPEKNDAYHPYPIRQIVDRVGAGDAFAAGLIFAMSTPQLGDPAAFRPVCRRRVVSGSFHRR